MARSLGSLVVDIGANIATLKTDMQAAKSTVEQAMGGITRAAQSAKSALGLLGVGFGAFEVAGSIKSAIDFGDKLKDMATATGASVEQLSFLDFVAKQSNTSLDALASGVGKLQRNLADVASGKGEKAADALRLLGLNAKTLAQIDVVSQLTTIGDALQRLQNPAQRAQAGAALFGKSVQELVPLLLEGRGGLQAMLERFIQLGGVITGKQASLFDGFNDGLAELSVAARGASAVIATDIAPALTTFVRFLATELPKGTDFVRNFADSLIQGFLGIDKAIQQGNLAIAKGLQASLGKLPGFDFTAKIEAAKQSIAEIDAIVNESIKDQDERLAARKAAQAAALKAILTPPKPPGLTDVETAAQEAARDAERKRRLAAEIAQSGQVLSQHLRDIEEESRFWEEKERHKASLRQQIETTPEKVLRELKDFKETFGVDSEEFGRRAVQAYDELLPPIKEATSAAKEFGLIFSSAFEDAITSGKDLIEVVRALAQDIIKMFARKTVTEPLADAVSGLFDSVTGGGFGGLFSKLFGGARASGGPVWPGSAFLVGERGPEIFVPRGAGNIVPNGATGSGGSNVVINVINQGADIKTRDRGEVDGMRQIDFVVQGTLGRLSATGRGAANGLVPALTPR